MHFDHSTFRRLCDARGLLALHADQPLGIAEAARAAGMSPFHFIRQFEALFGSTPHQYRIGLRIDRAKRLLASRELSVTETCLEVGMSSLGSFSTLFHQRVGVTPVAFQRRARTMVRVPGRLPTALFPGCLSLMGLLPAAAFQPLHSRNFREAKPDPPSLG
ncbi:MAG: AraC family transcriptional regulator [Acidobacteria bacterium]|nr:AraC family transcriptional regulator [Acidobacteriota bacterium]